VVSGGLPDHARLARLSLAALLRAAKAANGGATAGAQVLLNELRKSGDDAAGAALRSREQALRNARPEGVAGHGLQINIRQALGELGPRQARHHLARLVPAVAVLAEIAAAEGAEEMDSIAGQLLAVVGKLRQGTSDPRAG
jgi:hypothetical protein